MSLYVSLDIESVINKLRVLNSATTQVLSAFIETEPTEVVAFVLATLQTVQCETFKNPDYQTWLSELPETLTKVITNLKGDECITLVVEDLTIDIIVRDLSDDFDAVLGYIDSGRDFVVESWVNDMSFYQSGGNDESKVGDFLNAAFSEVAEKIAQSDLTITGEPMAKAYKEFIAVATEAFANRRGFEHTFELGRNVIKIVLNYSTELH